MCDVDDHLYTHDVIYFQNTKSIFSGFTYYNFHSISVVQLIPTAFNCDVFPF